jgi:CRP-like cAMP-binding protein
MPASPVNRLLAAALGLGEGAVVDDVGALFRSTPVHKGDALLAQGETWQHAFLIESGALRLYFVRRDGREFNKNFYIDGALICPLTPAMWAAPSLFGMASLGAGTVWRADATAFRAVLDRHAAWEPLQRELLARLVTHKLQREHDLLALDGRRRYQAFCARHPHLMDRVPLVHLASYLGLTDVSLSRIRRDSPVPAQN